MKSYAKTGAMHTPLSRASLTHAGSYIRILLFGNLELVTYVPPSRGWIMHLVAHPFHFELSVFNLVTSQATKMADPIWEYLK